MTHQPCARCGEDIRSISNVKYCRECKRLRTNEANIASHKRQRETCKSARIKAECYTHKPRKVLMRDEDQKAINKAVDDKYSFGIMPVKSYKGTPEFQRIAQEITHISRIAP